MKLTSKPQIKLEVNLTLDEDECLALDAIIGYGADKFLDVFYTHLGKSYLQPHEKGVRSLFTGLKETLPEALNKIENARKAVN